MLAGVSGNQLDLELDLEMEPGSVFRLGILATGGRGNSHRDRLRRRHAAASRQSYVLLDREHSSLDRTVDAEEKSGPVQLPGGKLHLRVLVDRSALEIFANGKPLTARAYPTLGGEAVRLSAAGTVRLQQLDAWRMEGVFGGPRPLFPSPTIVDCSVTALLGLHNGRGPAPTGFPGRACEARMVWINRWPKSILASVPLLLSHGVSYSLEAQAAGERLTVTFDGRAAYQDVLVTGSG